MIKHSLPGWAAGFFGAVVFLPQGFSYAALILLALALLTNKNAWLERWSNLRSTPHWWFACAILVWAGILLISLPTYPETSSNLFHLIRIVFTLAVVMMLTAEEANFAFRGFFIGLGGSLLIILLNQFFGLENIKIAKNLIYYSGNKSISNALMMALAAATMIIWLPKLRSWRLLLVFCMLLSIILTLFMVLPSRTAWLSLITCCAIGVLYKIRRATTSKILMGVGALMLMIFGVLQTPQISSRINDGVSQVINANKVEKISESGSWGIRYRVYAETLEMIRERPLTGWGIGAWNQKWRERVEPEMAKFNMPHNDFLWIGSQAGIVGILLLFFLVCANFPQAWKSNDINGCLSVMAITAVLISILFNTGLRDAAIGLPFWYIALIYQRIRL